MTALIEETQDTTQLNNSGLWELPSGWHWLSLGSESLTTIIMGQSPPGDTYNSEGIGLPFFQGKADFGQVYPTATKWCTEPKKIALANDVLISVRAPVGPNNIANEKCCIGRGLAAIRSTTHLDSYYLFYYVRSIQRIVSNIGKGSTFASINRDELSKIPIPIPYPNNPENSLRVQRQIVARLERTLGELKDVRDTIQEMKDNLEQVMDAALNEVIFQSKMEQVPLQVVAGDTERVNPLTYVENTFKYVDIGSVNKTTGIIETDKVLDIEKTLSPSRARKLIKKNDIVFATTRPYLRNIAFVPDVLDNQICSTGFCVIRAKQNLAVPKYLYYMCRSDFVVEQVTKKQTGASYPAVRDSDVYATLIPIPTPSEPQRSVQIQKQIVAHLDGVQAEVEQMRKAIEGDEARMAQAEQAILEQAFRGEL